MYEPQYKFNLFQLNLLNKFDRNGALKSYCFKKATGNRKRSCNNPYEMSWRMKRGVDVMDISGRFSTIHGDGL